MADFSEDDDPNSMFRKCHATPTPRFETFRLDFKPLRDTASDNSALDDDCVLPRRHLSNRVPVAEQTKGLYSSSRRRVLRVPFIKC